VRKDMGVPVFSGVPFLTGIGQDKIIDQLVAVLTG
jgi:hypothetical protein